MMGFIMNDRPHSEKTLFPKKLLKGSKIVRTPTVLWMLRC